MSINLGVRDKHIASEFYLPAPVATDATNIDYDSFYANWNQVAIVDGYYLDVAYDNGFTSYVVGYQNLDVGDVVTYSVADLEDDQTYYYRLRAYLGVYVSSNSNIITVETATIYTACATNGPYLDPEPIDDEMFLSCGALYLTSGTLGHYVIEWNLGSTAGETQFVSGDDQLFDPDIQAEQPFADEVVFAGDLYAVIRYVYIDGIKYTSEWEVGSRYSPDLATCLGYYTIFCIECTTLYGGDVTYPNFKLTYNKFDDIGYDKSRNLKYCICSDMDYLGWYFRTYTVSDQLKIYYCTALDPVGTLVDNFITGYRDDTGNYLTTNLNPGSYPTDPRVYNTGSSNALKFITDLTGFTYTLGDYLRIEIIGSCLEPLVTNTQWELKLQWFNETDIDNSFFTTDISKPSATYTMAWTGDPTCTYTVSAPTIVTPTSGVYNAYWLTKYTDMTAYNYPLATNDYVSCSWRITASNQHNVNIGFNFNENREGLVNVSKTTSNITFTFASANDYTWFKGKITATQANSYYTQWLVSSPTDIEYFRGYYIAYYVGPEEGDDYTTILYFSIHYSSTITYDDDNQTVDFSIEIPTNTFTAADCDLRYTAVSNFITEVTTTKNYTIPPAYADTYISSIEPFGFHNVYVGYSYYSTSSLESFFAINEILLNNIIDLTAQGFCRVYYSASVGYQLRFYRGHNRLTLTNTTDHTTRLANWTYERRVFLRTDDCADYSTWETVETEP